jgi:hypothetical protein
MLVIQELELISIWIFGILIIYAIIITWACILQKNMIKKNNNLTNNNSAINDSAVNNKFVFKSLRLNHKIKKNADGSLNLHHLIEVGEKLLIELTPATKLDERIKYILENRNVQLNDGIDYFTINRPDILSLIECLLDIKKKN